MYKEMKRQKKLEEEARAAALLEGMKEGEGEGLKLRKVDLKEFPNFKRKLVV